MGLGGWFLVTEAGGGVGVVYAERGNGGTIVTHVTGSEGLVYGTRGSWRGVGSNLF